MRQQVTYLRQKNLFGYTVCHLTTFYRPIKSYLGSKTRPLILWHGRYTHHICSEAALSLNGVKMGAACWVRQMCL